MDEAVHPYLPLLQLLGCQGALLRYLAPVIPIPVQNSGDGPGCGLQLQFSLDVLAGAEPFVPPQLDKLNHLLHLLWREQILATICSIPAPTILVVGGGEVPGSSRIINSGNSILDCLFAFWTLAPNGLDNLLDVLPLQPQLLPKVLFISTYHLGQREHVSFCFG